MSITPHMLPQSFFPACGCTLSTEDGARIYICPRHQREPGFGEAQSGRSTPPSEQPGRSASSNVDTNSVEGTETDAPIRDRTAEILARWEIVRADYAAGRFSALNHDHRARWDDVLFLLDQVAAAEARASQAERARDEAYERGRLDGLQSLASGMKKVLTPESVQNFLDVLRCPTCRTAAYQPNERCTNHRYGGQSGQLDHFDSGDRGTPQSGPPEGREPDGGGVCEAAEGSRAHGGVGDVHARREGEHPAAEGVADLIARAEAAEARADLLQQERDRLREGLKAARDAMAAFGKQAGWLPAQQAYACTMTQAEKDLADAVASLDRILAATPHGGTDTDPS